MKKTGVLLIQLGTPDSPKTSDVRRYLTEFLNDPRVMDIPWIFRKILVNLIIVPFRSPKSAKVYRELWDLGMGESPIITHSFRLKEKLEKYFREENVHFHLAMRYQNPSMYDVLETMRKQQYDRIVLLPLFPQYASATTGSALELAFKIIQKWWVIPEVHVVRDFWNNEGYIESIVEQASQFDLSEYDHVLFSYHGLPERQVEKVHFEGGNCETHRCRKEINPTNKDCYVAHCFATTRLIVEKLGIKEGEYHVVFQSRLTKRWIQPYADDVIEELAKSGKKKLLVFSPAFVADCLETLIEIGEEYQELFEKHGGEKVQLVPSSNSKDSFVKGIESVIRNKIKVVY